MLPLLLILLLPLTEAPQPPHDFHVSYGRMVVEGDGHRSIPWQDSIQGHAVTSFRKRRLGHARPN